MQSREGKFLLAEFQCLGIQLIRAPGSKKKEGDHNGIKPCTRLDKKKCSNLINSVTTEVKYNQVNQENFFQ